MLLDYRYIMLEITNTHVAISEATSSCFPVILEEVLLSLDLRLL